VLGNLQQAAAGEKINPGRQPPQVRPSATRRSVASNWLTRGAYNRLVLDNLQWLLDPEADKSFKAQAAGEEERPSGFREEKVSL
jgi:hypothetical protein